MTHAKLLARITARPDVFGGKAGRHAMFAAQFLACVSVGGARVLVNV